MDDFVCYYYDGVGQRRVTWLREGISFLRGYDNRLEGSTALEGTFRYGHQGGGQMHTLQLISN